MLILCDIDGVLADDAWRRSFIKPRNPDLNARYRDYHMSSVIDNSHNHDLICVRGARVVLLTAMPEEYSGLRERWLAERGLRYERILFRSNRDHSDSVTVKRAMLAQLVNEGYNLSDCIAAYDDRQEVVDMYCEHNLPGVRVSIDEAKRPCEW